MTSSTQREALAVLAELCDLSDDVRLGQLMAHLGFLGEDQAGRSLWDIEDEQLLAVLYRHRAELIARAAHVPFRPSALNLNDEGAPIADSNASRPS